MINPIDKKETGFIKKLILVWFLFIILLLLILFSNCSPVDRNGFGGGSQEFATYSCPERLKDETPQQYNSHLTPAELHHCEWKLE